VLLAGIFAVQAQNVVVLENVEYKNKLDAFFNNNPKFLVIQEGTVVTYKFQNQKKIRKDKVENILYPFYLIIGEKPYNLTKFETIKFARKGRWIKRVVGPAMMGFGAGVMASGYSVGYYVVQGMMEGSHFVFAVSPLTFAGATVGIGVIILGADIVIKGIKMTYNSWRRPTINPNDGKKWKVKVVDKKELKELRKDEKKEKTPKPKNGDAPNPPGTERPPMNRR
jgi:hypothetical protein